MTRDETKKILMSMDAIFPNFKPQNLTEMINAWTKILDEYDYNQVDLALKAYVLSDTSGFAPSPGQLVEKIHSMNAEEALSDMEAWYLVRKAVGRSIYYSEEEFAKLPSLIQKAVGAPGQLRNWAMTDSEDLETVVKSHFVKTYRAVVMRDAEITKMPTEIRNLIATANNNRPQLYTKAEAQIETRQEEYKRAEGEELDAYPDKMWEVMGVNA